MATTCARSGARCARRLIAQRPVVIHCATVKGKGFAPSEEGGLEGMEKWHAAKPKSIANGVPATTGKPAPGRAGPPQFTQVFGNALVEECRRDERVIGITAAMNSGTGLNILQRELPDRYFDVGIAEQQAVLFAAGLALQGCKPVAAIYSTFLQRAYDQIVHDVCLQKLNVVFAMDRAGLVGDDGPTHHGAFDIAYLRCLPNIVLMAPRDEAMLVHMLRTALTYDDGPIALRYPRGEGVGVPLPARPEPIEIGTGEILREGERVALLGYGTGVGKALEAADILAEHGLSVTVADARFAKPIDVGLAAQLAAEHELLVTVEEGVLAGGFGSAVWESLSDVGLEVGRAGSGSSGLACPTGTSPTARRSSCTRRSGSPASGSPSGSNRPSPSTAACRRLDPLLSGPPTVEGRRSPLWSAVRDADNGLMATQLGLDPRPSEPADASSELFISRQPVVDGQMRVTGYRVAYATSDGSEHGDGTAARLLGDVLSGVGLDDLVGESLAHLPLSRELLLALGVPPVRPDRVLLRIAHDTARHSEVAGVLDALTGRGYALSLHDLPGPDFDAALLDMFGTVEIELHAWSPEDAARAVSRIRGERAMPLAAGLHDYNEFEQAKQLGFDLFSGPFYASRHKAAVRKIPIGEMGTLVALAALQGGSATIEDLEAVIDRDVGLSVKLLRYINSAYIGLRGSIGSIRQAVMMLGSRGVSRWALLVALTGGPNAPRELSVMGLTRARMCELLGADLREVAGDQLFTVGLLSVADALLEVPLETIVEELPLADEVSAALTEARRARRRDPEGRGQLRAGRIRRRHAAIACPRHRQLLPRCARLGGRDRVVAGRLSDHVPFRVSDARSDRHAAVPAGDVPVTVRRGGVGARRRRAAPSRPPAGAEARPARVRRGRARGRPGSAVRFEGGREAP